jgi:hypothetical protein
MAMLEFWRMTVHWRVMHWRKSTESPGRNGTKWSDWEMGKIGFERDTFEMETWLVEERK